MRRAINIVTILVLLTAVVSSESISQERTVGLFLNDTSRAWVGYTLLAPKLYHTTYLINNAGRIINQWSRSQLPPGQSVYLMPNGNLLRSCMIRGRLNTGGGEGGRIEEYTWGDTLVWEFEYVSDTYMAHHDIRPLPNGNVLMLAVEKKTYQQCLDAGFTPAKIAAVQQQGYMLPDFVIEVEPNRPRGGRVVWEWHVWDHLIQDYDRQKANFGTVRDHPELVDADGDGRNLPVFWNHMNAVNYNAELDQVLLSVRGNSEVWVIDHSTTTAEAASHQGGTHGVGGDLLYRWGNPSCYGIGDRNSQKLVEQHDAQWIESDRPGGGDMLAFSNGNNRNYSTVEQWTPPVDGAGNYSRDANAAFGPADYSWRYIANPPQALYATAISGAQRLPNGNTLICDGTHGTLIEVTREGETVWKYVCPVISNGPMMQGDSIPADPAHADEKQNMVFRVQRYAPDHPGLQGRDLAPGDFIERYPNEVGGFGPLPTSFALMGIYPNPFNGTTRISFGLPQAGDVSVKIFDLSGREVATLMNSNLQAGNHEVTWQADGMSSGLYLVKLDARNYRGAIPVILVK